MAEPFMRWVGGKRSLLETLRSEIERLPWLRAPAPSYFEPFLGGGALFFALEESTRGRLIGVLGDILPAVCDVFRGIQRDPLAVAELANHWPVTPREFERLRTWDGVDPIEKAARVIWLNRCCFNGLWREGPRGFNSTWGNRPESFIVADAARLVECSRALAHSMIRGPEDWSWIRDPGVVPPKSLVYLDPPYLHSAAKKTFIGYGQAPFGWPEHKRLADAFDALVAAGSWVLLSNSGEPWVRDRYRDHRVIAVRGERSVAAQGERRTAAADLLVVGGPGVPRGFVVAAAPPHRPRPCARAPKKAAQGRSTPATAPESTTRVVAPSPLVRVVVPHGPGRRRDLALKIAALLLRASAQLAWAAWQSARSRTERWRTTWKKTKRRFGRKPWSAKKSP